MSDDENGNDFFSELQSELGDLWRALGDAWREAMVGFRNGLRRLRRARVDYVVIPISGPLPERSGPPRSFIQRQLPLPPEPLSIQTLNARLQAIADAENVRGAVFILREFSAPGLATLQNLRRSIERLREAGKEAIVFTSHLDLVHYYVACAADRIVAPPSAHFEVLGLRVEALFLREALEQVGVHPDVIQISPYKTAGNIFEKTEITPEQEEQLTWLLEDNFDMITAGIATGRGISQEEVKALIDRAPLFPDDTLAAGLVDELAYEDELPSLLALPNGESAQEAQVEPGESEPETAHPAESDASNNVEHDSTVEAIANPENPEDPPVTSGYHQRPNQDEPKAKLLPWSEARGLLLEKARRPFAQYVGVVSLEGAIVTGPSRQPPIDLPIPFIGGAVAGHETINTLLRQAERQDRMAALIFHVDSGGGSALASDLIWRQIERIARKKPVVLFMGNVAASGGYYVGAAARHIVSQPGTITGSIGVLMGRFSIDELYRKLHVNVATLQRGEHADLYSGTAPLTPEEQEILWQSLVETYGRFKQVVTAGREIPPDELDPVAEGRVWTGRQAQARNLVDSHGDFVDAVRTAIELAELPVEDPQRVRVANFYDRSQEYLTPLPFGDSLPSRVKEFLDATLTGWNGRTLAMLPFRIRFF